MNLNIYKAEEKDALAAAALAIQMWEDNELEDLAKEFVEIHGVAEEYERIFGKVEE